jgi:Cu/Ag efflux pump CusA
VTGWGGKTKTYELQIDLNKLIAYGITLPQMQQALNNSNINVGGSTINVGPQVAVVRGVGLIRSLDEIRTTMLTQVAGCRSSSATWRRSTYPISRDWESLARTMTTTSYRALC